MYKITAIVKESGEREDISTKEIKSHSEALTVLNTAIGELMKGNNKYTQFKIEDVKDEGDLS